MAEFSDTRSLLLRRPQIEFVEPDQIAGEQPAVVAPEITISEARSRTAELIEQYKRLEDLSNIAQQRIDSRAATVKICLDTSQDAAVIESLGRMFGSTEACITFKQYKECVQKVSTAGRDAAPTLTLEDMKKAVVDPFRKDFGGFGSTPGLLRPELQIDSPIKPIDIPKFKQEGLDELFRLLLPKLIGLNNFLIEKAIEKIL